jgi:hypothetical protein
MPLALKITIAVTIILRFSLLNAFICRFGKRGAWDYCCWWVVISCIRPFCVG